MSEPTTTHVLLRICARYVRAPRSKETNYSLARALGVGDATVWNTLQKLEAAGWLRSEVERRNPMEPTKPARRLYRITDAGAVNAKALLSDLQCPGLTRAST